MAPCGVWKWTCPTAESRSEEQRRWPATLAEKGVRPARSPAQDHREEPPGLTGAEAVQAVRPPPSSSPRPLTALELPGCARTRLWAPAGRGAASCQRAPELTLGPSVAQVLQDHSRRLLGPGGCPPLKTGSWVIAFLPQVPQPHRAGGSDREPFCTEGCRVPPCPEHPPWRGEPVGRL